MNFILPRPNSSKETINLTIACVNLMTWQWIILCEHQYLHKTQQAYSDIRLPAGKVKQRGTFIIDVYKQFITIITIES